MRRPSPVDAWAWLPTADGRPLPSSPLLKASPEGTAATIAPWHLGTLRLAPADAHALLVAADGARVRAPGALVSDDLAFWARAFRFAAALVAREAFLPGLAATPEGGRSHPKPRRCR